MSSTRGVLLILAAILAAGVGGYGLGYLGLGTSEFMTTTGAAQTNAPASSGPVIYYRDPDDKPFYSLEPKQTPDGRPYRAVLASEDISFDTNTAKSATLDQPPGRRIIYYRNPMGLPDTSPVPKKDWMGMAYIAGYDGGDSEDASVRLSPGNIQRTAA